MEENKVYRHNGREFKLRKKFLLKDLEASQRVDAFFKKIKYDSDKQEFFGEKFTSEDFIQLMNDVLIPVDGEKIEKNFFENMEQAEALEVFQDFFFVYHLLSAESQRNLERFEKKVNGYIQRLSS